MTKQPDTAEFQPFDFVYSGRCALKGGKAGAEIHRLDDGRLAGSYVFEARSLKGKVIGGIYRGALFTDNKARGLDDVKYVDRWKDQGACIDWRARDEAFDTNQRLCKLEAEAKKINEIEAIMLPLRKLHATYLRQYDNAGKEALEQAVMRALRSPPRKTESE